MEEKCKYQKGDKVKVIGNYDHPIVGEHYFEIGVIGIIRNVVDASSSRDRHYLVFSEGCNGSWFVMESDLEKIDDEEMLVM